MRYFSKILEGYKKYNGRRQIKKWQLIELAEAEKMQK